MCYQVYGEYPRERILPLLTDGVNNTIEFEGFIVHTGTTRLQTLKRSQVCSNCGREGVVFRLERTLRKWERQPEDRKRICGILRPSKYQDTPHFNLYAVEFVWGRVNGRRKRVPHYILMTRDHIYPKSKGGPDSIDNSQTMCAKCNQRKANIIKVSEISKQPVQEMLKSIPVRFPLQVVKPFIVNF